MPTIKTGKWGKYHIKENNKLFLYPQEWNKILKLANDKQKETFMMQINTGARYNEAKHIKVEDVDYVRNNLILKVTKVRARKKETKPSHRHIPISSQFRKFLEYRIKKYNLQSTDYFPMLSLSGTEYALRSLVRKIGRTDWQDFSSHNLRKTFECWLIALNNDGFKVAKHLGHTPDVAMNTYISPDIFTYEDKQLIRKIIGDLYAYHDRM